MNTDPNLSEVSSDQTVNDIEAPDPHVETSPLSEFEKNFETVGYLGDGTFGSVFKAMNKLDKCEYAVKQIRFRTHDTKVKLKEVRALALISHPGIVKYYYSWIENDEIVSYLYIQMELCKSTLEDWLSSNRNRELPKIKYFLAQIVSAVDYIHGLGKIHRDLKPSNILFANENQLKVCDLGLVTDIDNNLHGNGNVGNSEDCLRTRTFGQGTPPYMAPEQMGFTRYSNKVDIFTLGLIMSELVCDLNKDDKYEAFRKYQNGETCSSLEERLKEVEGPTEKPTNSFMKPEFKEKIMQLEQPFDFVKWRERLLQKTEEFESEFAQKFVPLGVIAFGDFGTIFEAKHVLDEIVYAVRQVSVKSIHAESVFNELRPFASLDHDNIIRYYSCWMEPIPIGFQGYLSGVYLRKVESDSSDPYYNNYFRDDSVIIYIQMELCMCKLSEWIRDNERIDLEHSKLWLRQIVSGLAFLLRNTKMIPDLAPSNIRVDKFGNLKIGGYGDIESDDFDPTEARMYWAPEQTGNNDTPKTCAFVLGLILVELCVMMNWEEREEVFYKYRKGQPVDTIDHLLEAKELVAWLTRVNPDERPDYEEILKHSFLANS